MGLLEIFSQYFILFCHRHGNNDIVVFLFPFSYPYLYICAIVALTSFISLLVVNVPVEFVVLLLEQINATSSQRMNAEMRAIVEASLEEMGAAMRRAIEEAGSEEAAIRAIVEAGSEEGQAATRATAKGGEAGSEAGGAAIRAMADGGEAEEEEEEVTEAEE